MSIKRFVRQIVREARGSIDTDRQANTTPRQAAIVAGEPLTTHDGTQAHRILVIGLDPIGEAELG